MNFESELKKWNLVISECIDCNKITWPPSAFCNQCLKQTSWRQCSSNGKIIEFSKQNDVFFAVVEFENSIRIIGKITSGTPEIGKSVKVTECGIAEDGYLLKIKVVE